MASHEIESLVRNFRGAAQFYRDSPNMGENIVNCYGVNGHFVVTADDLDHAADLLNLAAWDEQQ